MNFEITFDYLCPFARNANESVLAGLAEGRDWEVGFRPFSLSEVHVTDGEESVIGDTSASGVLALNWGVAVRDSDPGHFPAAHVALFAARHDEGQDIGDEAVIRNALLPTGVDVDAVGELVASGTPAKTLAGQHAESVERWRVFGVPTFIIDDVATFVRLMDRNRPDEIDRLLTFVEWQGLNEFKRTEIPR